MVQVVDYEEFSALKRLVEELQADNAFLKSLLTGERWLSRVQAMKAIGCSGKTLKRLADAKRLTFRYEGAKPYYDAFSIRAYLTAQRIDSVVIDKRVLTAKYGT